jgi:hypothetical protein
VRLPYSIRIKDSKEYSVYSGWKRTQHRTAIFKTAYEYTDVTIYTPWAIYDDIYTAGTVDKIIDEIHARSNVYPLCYDISIQGERLETTREIEKRLSCLKELEERHTQELLNISRSNRHYYNCGFHEFFNGCDILRAVLDTREHVLNKSERKAWRLAKAKFQRS